MGKTSSKVKDRYNAKVYDEIKVRVSKGDKDKKFAEALKRDLDYLAAHRDELIADNQDEVGIVFFYGTFEDYPAYIDEWCEDEYTMTT